jgi:hypothetical protein
VIFILVGSGTSAITVVSPLYELAYGPDMRRRLKTEIRAAFLDLFVLPDYDRAQELVCNPLVSLLA